MVEKAMTPAVTQEMILIAWVLFFALKYRHANLRYKGKYYWFRNQDPVVQEGKLINNNAINS